MFALFLAVLAFVAFSSGQAGIPPYVQGRWEITPDDLQYYDPDGPFLAAEESTWPESSPDLVTAAGRYLSITPEPPLVQEPESKDHVKESALWEVVVVTAVLLVSVVGSLSVAYYLCVWRGGRIHYQPQKEGRV